VNVRDLEWGDFQGWVALYYTRYDEVTTNRDLGIYTYESKPSLADEAALFGAVWKKVLAGDHVGAVGEDGGKLIGLCTISRKGQHLEDRHAGILGIAVHPNWRGRGLGSMLLAHALKRCEGKFEIVQLAVTEKNLQAQALYRRFGFVESGRLPRAFQRDGVYLDDILMWRAIAPSTDSGRVASPVRANSGDA
jgi:ribosomal protein S18 acetylase RimI-like enzyme